MAADNLDERCQKCGLSHVLSRCWHPGCRLERGASGRPRCDCGRLLSVQGRYQIIGRLGGGDRNDVLLALDDGMDRRHVVVKQLKLDHADDPRAVRRFLQEGTALSRMDSNRVPRVYDCQRLPPNPPFLVMEYIAGPDLDEWLEGQGGGDAPSLDTAIALTIELLEGLEAAHRAGIVHRDIKPGNLKIEGASRRPALKVLDFDVSHVEIEGTTTRPTTAANVLGTYKYMAPEQLLSPQEVDLRADLYSAAVVLHEMIFREVPYESEWNSVARYTRGAETLHAVQNLCNTIRLESPPRRWPRGRPLPDMLSRVLRRGLQGSPDARFANAAEFRVALEGLRSPPVSATLAAPPPRWWKRRAATLATLVFAVTVVAIAVAFKSGPASPPDVTTRGRLDPSLAFGTSAPAESPPLAPAPAVAPAGTKTSTMKPTSPSCPDGMRSVGARADGACLDEAEVSVADYSRCVHDGACQEPASGEGCNWRVAGRAGHPVNCVSAREAIAYCNHQHKQLATKREWETAVRGPDGRRGAPWIGARAPKQLCFNAPHTCPARSLPSSGLSPEGFSGLAGNVNDLVGAGRGFAMCGGSYEAQFPRSFDPNRECRPYNRPSSILGFRCALHLPQAEGDRPVTP